MGKWFCGQVSQGTTMFKKVNQFSSLLDFSISMLIIKFQKWEIPYYKTLEHRALSFTERLERIVLRRIHLQKLPLKI